MKHGRRNSVGQIGVGVFLLIVGALLLLDKIDILNITILDNISIWRLWPVIFLAIGISQLLNAESPREYHKYSD
jgi:divalent metal cation (Fe/Co/Zn/Cd) transporter